ncbi:MAG: hypothetical protein ABI843_09695 [Dokdonella sp.]
MTSRTLCFLDTNACNAQLLIREGNRIVTTRNNALNDLNRTVHGALAVASGTYRFETYHWSKSRTSFAGLYSLGVAQASGGLTSALDSAAGQGFGLRPADGLVVSGGANLATVLPIGERVCIGVYLFLSAAVCTCTWLVDGTAVYTAALPNGKVWVPALSLGGAQAGDRQASFNFGQDRFDRFDGNDGWFRLTSGLDTIHVSLASEAFMSASTDTPANTQYSPDIVDAKSIHRKCAPLAWPDRTSSTSVAASSSFSSVTFRNDKGQYNALRDADVRDSTFVMQKLDAPAFGAGTLTAASNQFVAIIDSITAPSRSTVQIQLKGTLSRLDKPCPVRRIPPFYDEASAGKAMPIGLGARRNGQPVLLDEEQNLYLIGDAPQTNVPLVTDGGGTLDALAAPPQWLSALNGCGIQLQSKPIYRVSYDASTYGGQYQSGLADVLNGDGSFTTWTSGVPHGFALPTTPPFAPSVTANGSISQDTTSGGSALKIVSRVPYNPGVAVGSYYGYPVPLASTPLLPGRTYRIRFTIKQGVGATPDGARWGFCILTGLADDPRYWVTPFHDFLTWALPGTGGNNFFNYEYTVPSSLTTPLPLYLCLNSLVDTTASAPTANLATITIDDLVVELVGQFTSAPLVGMTLTQAFNEILVVRAGESPSIFSDADTQQIDEDTGILIGLEYDDQPNIVQMLQDAADNYGAVVFEDENNVIRVRRMTDPRFGTPVAAFSKPVLSSDDKAFIITSDPAPGLTTSFACRKNQVPFTGTGDFVTDEAVSLSQREAWSGAAQIEFSSSSLPAQQYAFSVGAPRFIFGIDDPAMAMPEGNRMVRLYAPDAPGLPTPPGQVGAETSATAGKGKLAQFEVTYNADGTIGVGTTVAPQRLYPCDVIVVTVPELGLNATPMSVKWTDNYPVDGRIIICGRYQ